MARTSRRQRSTLRIVSAPHADETRRARVREGVDLHNVARTGLDAYYPVNLFLDGDDGEVAGGLLGGVWGRWLHVSHLWIAEPFRGHGWARRLLAQAEAFAVARDCVAAHLDSFSFQAPAMYEKLGYQVFGVLEDHPPGHRHVFLYKPLVPRARRRAR